MEFVDAEMFTDSYKMKVTDDGIFYEVQGNVSKIEKDNKPNTEIYNRRSWQGLNTMCNGVFLTNCRVLRDVRKHCTECLIDPFDQIYSQT